MVFYLSKGEAIFRVAITLGNKAVNFTVFLEHFSEFPFDLGDISLSKREGYLSVDIGDEEFVGGLLFC